jgi:exopolysaccharide biosynthesis polyprenyl glycosylphosphotransferase
MPVAQLFILLSLALDAAMVGLSYRGAFWLRFQSGWWPQVPAPAPEWAGYGKYLWALVPLYLLMFKYAGLYRVRRSVSGTDELSRVGRAALIAALLSAAGTFLVRELLFSRLVLMLTAAAAGLSVWLARRVLALIQVFLRRQGMLSLTKLLVVGSGESARSMLRRLKDNPAQGYEIVGVVSESADTSDVEGVKVVGVLPRFTEALEKAKPQEVLFALPAQAHSLLIPLLVELQDTGVRYRIVSDLFGLITNPMEADELLGVPVFEMKEAPLTLWYNRALKRTFDVVLSAFALAVLSPVFAVLALCVRFSSPGPILFKQKRVGRDGKVFTMYKFRSMKIGSETAAFTQENDPRRTKFGIFIRKTSLDELPQFYNVLQGRMSLVGPRPEVPALVEQFEKTVPRYFERHQVKAGISGWAQVHGLRGNTSLEERVKYDIYYIENWSLWLDLRILVRTALDILEHSHAY